MCQFFILEAAVTAAGLEDFLSDCDATFTVFAPTDDAFAKLPADRTVDGMNALKYVLFIAIFNPIIICPIQSSSQGWKAQFCIALSRFEQTQNRTT